MGADVPADFLSQAGATPTAAISPPSLTKNDLREQCGLTMGGVRLKFPARQRSSPPNVKQNLDGV
jgi:hypothetical protein